MKTPTWAIVIGICIILFGGCSVTKNIQSINLPDMLEMQKKIMDKMAESSKTNSTDSLSTISNVDSTTAQNIKLMKNMAEGMQEMLSISEFTITWTVRFGYMGLFVSFMYILSGVFLLVKRNFSIKLAYTALVTSILFSGIKTLVLASDSSGGILAKTAGIGNLFGIIIDIILIIVIVSMDKTAFEENKKEIA